MLSKVEFVKLCVQIHKNGGGMKELETATQLKRATLIQKRSALRAEGYPIPEFRKGRAEGSGSKGVTEAELQEIASLTGQTLEEVRAASEATKKAVAEHAARVKQGKNEAANTSSTPSS